MATRVTCPIIDDYLICIPVRLAWCCYQGDIQALTYHPRFVPWRQIPPCGGQCHSSPCHPPQRESAQGGQHNVSRNCRGTEKGGAMVCINSFQVQIPLTHWGRVMYICVSKLTIIGSDNGLLPGPFQAIIWTNVGILLIGPLGTNFSQILIEIYTF